MKTITQYTFASILVFSPIPLAYGVSIGEFKIIAASFIMAKISFLLCPKE